jgi:SAM-dependent methyltransferase
MDRATFLKEKRRLTEERMDTLFAPLYDEKWGVYGNATHQAFVQKLLSLISGPGAILDAACGTGKYWPMLLERGHSVVGIDQSEGMLSRARAKFPGVHVEKIGLQEIDYREVFDGLICVDAMEFVFPEDWPLVVGNLCRAMKPGAPAYLTVELAAAEDVRADFEKGWQLGLPVVYGESADVGYHYYPELARVREWLHEARFRVIEEAEGDEYRHFLLRRDERTIQEGG